MQAGRQTGKQTHRDRQTETENFTGTNRRILTYIFFWVDF